MLRSAHFSALAVLRAACCRACAAAAASAARTAGGCAIFYGIAPAAARLRINAHGPVTLKAASSNDLSYTVSVSVSARTEAEARRVLQQYTVRLESQGAVVVLTAPGGPVMTSPSR